jgi:hypothetical protein
MRNSRCCGSVIWRIGSRRRQCSRCLRTWRVWKNKRGRRPRKNHERLLNQVFREKRSLTQLAKTQGFTRQAFSYRFLQALSRDLSRGRRPSASLSSDRLILVADGLWFRFRNRPWVLYQMALRPVESNTAMLIDPLLLRGRETKAGWELALASIPADQKERIRVIVVDNFSGSTGIAKENGWLLQLCIFHGIAPFRARLGKKSPDSSQGNLLRREAFRLVQRATKMPEGPEVQQTVNRLAELARQPHAGRFADMLREFVRSVGKYRAYRLHPDLRLPRTTGTLESAGARMRALMRRTCGFSTPRSLRLWSTVYSRRFPEITCNPGN